mmetsp:Transcript_63468/g.183947  ORF Transcript_63468/g.183947 Transcript_63468/m.183947 type:complete len:549 (-) Transcript_63468:207-1853(-)
MAADIAKQAWYRSYVLLVLLAFCISSLATRNLLAYLVTVPVPECEDTCRGVRAPQASCWRQPAWPTDRDPSREELCALCKARVGPAPSQSLLSAGEDQHRRGSRLWKSRLLQRKLEAQAQTFSQALTQVGLRPWLPAIPWADAKLDAKFYNIADGACLNHGEYGLLIGYGFAFAFALGLVPASKVCAARSRVEVASLAILTWSLATAMQASAQSFWFLMGCRAAIGFAQAFAMPAAVSLTADYFLERQPAAAEVLGTGLHLGAGVASFSIFLAEAVGWRWTVLIAGFLGLFLAGLMFATVQEPARTEWSAPWQVSVVMDEVFEQSRVARLLTAAASAKMVAAYSLGAFLPLWYARRGLDGYTNFGYACWNALVVSCGGLLSAFIGSWLGRCWSSWDRRAPCWIGLLGATAALPCAALVLQTGSFRVSMLSFFFFILLSESWYGPVLSLLESSVKRSVRGQAVSMFLAATMLAGNFGPALVGFLDPGNDGIGAHLLWVAVAANLFAAGMFCCTAREIAVDPVAAGCGREAFRRSGEPAKAGTGNWAAML